MIEWLQLGLHYFLSFIVILSVIVFVHEFGHYIVAKWCGVKVLSFSIGFGPKIYGWEDRSGTMWKLSALPLGGYVKMYGDEGAASTPDSDALEEMTEEEKAVSFHYKPLWKKALVVGAGPVANFILTIAIMTYFLYAIGVASTDPVVGKVIEDTPAQAAGLQEGDWVVSVDDKPVKVFGDIPNLIATNLGEAIKLTIKRGEETLNLSITPTVFEDVDALGNPLKRPFIGIQSQQLTRKDFTFPQAVGEAVGRTYQCHALCKPWVD